MNCRKCGAKRITRRASGVFSCAHCGVQPNLNTLCRSGLPIINPPPGTPSMTSPVHTGKFFMLEGVIVSKGEVFILAVSFDRQALFDFTMKLGQSEVTDFDAFRITEQGDILVTELPKATHPTPPKAV